MTSKYVYQSKKYHYTYVMYHTNGKYYVGRRSTNKLPELDNYMGSGTWVKSIKDRTALTKKILNIYEDFETVLIAEMELIEYCYEDKHCMNMLYSSWGGVAGEKCVLYGVPRSIETKRKLSIAGTGRICTQETREKLSKLHIGRVRSKESVEKSASALRGIPRSAEVKRKLSIATTNMSAETREKMRLSHQNISDETKRKMSISGKNKHSSVYLNSSLAQQGEKGHAAILTDGQARQLKIRKLSGERTIDLSREYGIAQCTVSNICAGRSWKHIVL